METEQTVDSRDEAEAWHGQAPSRKRHELPRRPLTWIAGPSAQRQRRAGPAKPSRQPRGGTSAHTDELDVAQAEHWSVSQQLRASQAVGQRQTTRARVPSEQRSAGRRSTGRAARLAVLGDDQDPQADRSLVEPGGPVSVAGDIVDISGRRCPGHLHARLGSHSRNLQRQPPHVVGPSNVIVGVWVSHCWLWARDRDRGMSSRG